MFSFESLSFVFFFLKYVSLLIGLKTAYENGYVSVAVFDHVYKDEDIKRKYSHLYITDFKELI